MNVPEATPRPYQILSREGSPQGARWGGTSLGPTVRVPAPELSGTASFEASGHPGARSRCCRHCGAFRAEGRRPLLWGGFSCTRSVQAGPESDGCHRACRTVLWFQPGLPHLSLPRTRMKVASEAPEHPPSEPRVWLVSGCLAWLTSFRACAAPTARSPTARPQPTHTRPQPRRNESDRSASVSDLSVA